MSVKERTQIALIAIAFITWTGGTLTCVVTGHPIWAFVWFAFWGVITFAFIESAGEDK